MDGLSRPAPSRHARATIPFSASGEFWKANMSLLNIIKIPFITWLAVWSFSHALLSKSLWIKRIVKKREFSLRINIKEHRSDQNCHWKRCSWIRKNDSRLERYSSASFFLTGITVVYPLENLAIKIVEVWEVTNQHKINPLCHCRNESLSTLVNRKSFKNLLKWNELKKACWLTTVKRIDHFTIICA